MASTEIRWHEGELGKLSGTAIERAQRAKRLPRGDEPGQGRAKAAA